jgi:hypothetical protein
MKTDRRTDQVTAMLLDAAANADRGRTSFVPALEMLRLGVSSETATRVLTQPARRRAHINSKSDDAWAPNELS